MSSASCSVVAARAVDPLILPTLSAISSQQANVTRQTIANAHQLFQAGMQETLSGFAYPKQMEQTKILISDLEHSAILGAAALCD